MLYGIVIGIILILSTADGLLERWILPTAYLNTTEIFQYYGYPAEIHEVITTDGYILQLHRIPSKPRKDNTQVVLLMPGLLCSSVTFVLGERKKSLAFILSDLGYDVWIANSRGTTYSRKHIKLDIHKDAAAFWNFSVQEKGVYDLPESIDYILNATSQYKLSLISHSQGSTDIFVMASELPEYNEKIRLAVALAPIAFLSHLAHPLVRPLVYVADVIKSVANTFGVQYIPGPLAVTKFLGSTICLDVSPLQKFCNLALFAAIGWDPPQFNTTRWPLIAASFPAGASLKELVHYAQLVRSGKFRQYDYFARGNLKQYRQIQPPEYNLTKVTAPVALYYGENDLFAADKDVDRLADQLPRVVKKQLVKWKLFTHLDFVNAIDVNELLYNDLLELLSRF